MKCSDNKGGMRQSRKKNVIIVDKNDVGIFKKGIASLSIEN